MWPKRQISSKSSQKFQTHRHDIHTVCSNTTPFVSNCAAPHELAQKADILSKKPAMQIVLAEVTICSSTRCMINICRSEAKCALSLLIPFWQVIWKFTPQPFYVKAKPWSSNPYTGLGRLLRLQKIEAPRVSWQSAHWGGKVVSPTHRVTGISGSSPYMYRRFRFKSWYVPVIQVQVLICTCDSGSSPNT